MCASPCKCGSCYELIAAPRSSLLSVIHWSSRQAGYQRAAAGAGTCRLPVHWLGLENKVHRYAIAALPVDINCPSFRGGASLPSEPDDVRGMGAASRFRRYRANDPLGELATDRTVFDPGRPMDANLPSKSLFQCNPGSTIMRVFWRGRAMGQWRACLPRSGKVKALPRPCRDVRSRRRIMCSTS